jgi:adenylate cyclase class 2
LVRPEGLEPPAYWFEASRSIQLSYERIASSYHQVGRAILSPASERMPVETEIKLRQPDAVAIRAKLDQQGYQPCAPRTLEIDQIYDTPNGELRSTGRLLRLRSAGGQWTLTFKGPCQPDRYKSREEIESDVSDGPAMAQILIGLGYTPSFRYEKFRTKFKAVGEPGVVTLDETPMGVFMELEGPGYWIDQTAASLGFLPADYLTSSYAALYHEYRLSHPTVPKDMRF